MKLGDLVSSKNFDHGFGIITRDIGDEDGINLYEVYWCTKGVIEIHFKNSLKSAYEDR